MKKLITFFLISLIAAFAVGFQTPPDNKDEQYLLYPNELINGGGENGTANWSATGGTLTATTMSGNVRLGLRAIEWEPTAAAQTLSTNSWIVPQAATGNGLAKFFYKTSATDDIMAVMSGATTLAYQSITSNTVDFQEHKLNFVALAGSTITATVVSQSNSEKINVDGGYLGYADNVFEATSSTGWNDAGTMQISATTTAPSKGTATIVVDRMLWQRLGTDMHVRIEFRHSAAGTSTAGSGDYLWAIPSGYQIDTTKVTAYSTVEGWSSTFQNNNIVGICQAGNGTNQVFGKVVVYDGTYVRCAAESAALGAQGFLGSGGFPLNGTAQYYTFDFKVPIRGWGTQSAVSADQTDYGWTSYTPTFTGFGTVTNINCRHSRLNENMLLRCRFTCGTSTGTEARVSLPNNITTSSNMASLEAVGILIKQVVGSGYMTSLAEPSVGYITFGKDNATSSMSKELGSNLCLNGNNMSFLASVPIQGWIANQRAPSLMGSITSDSQASKILESATITSAGVVTENGGSDWIDGDCSIASSAYTCNFKRQFASNPDCWVSMRDNSASNNTHNIRSISTSAATINIVSATAGTNVTDRGFSLFCYGPR